MLVTTSLTNYKRRRFLQGVFERALTDYQKSDEAVKAISGSNVNDI